MSFKLTARGIEVDGKLMETATREGVAQHIKLMLGLTN